jgi:hypothetical protein
MWDILNVYKYVLSDDFTVFKVHYPYAIRTELKRLNLLKINETDFINEDADASPEKSESFTGSSNQIG